MAEPRHQRTVAAPGRLFPVLLPPARGQVEPVVGPVDQVGAARVAGVGVEDAVSVTQEGADAVHLAGPALPVGPEFGQIPVVVLHRGHGRVEGDVEVIAEVAAETGVPRNGPAHPLPERLDPGQRRPADHGQRGVAGVQVGQVTDGVGQERAGLAALIPVRLEHEVVDQQLAPALEQVEQARRPGGALEHVRLADLGHRQPAPLGVKRIPLPGELLLLRQQPLARGQPLVTGDNLRIDHANLRYAGGCLSPPRRTARRGWTADQ